MVFTGDSKRMAESDWGSSRNCIAFMSYLVDFLTLGFFNQSYCSLKPIVVPDWTELIWAGG